MQDIERKILDIENKFKQQIEQLRQELNKVEPQTSGRWIPKEGETYWYIFNGYVCSSNPVWDTKADSWNFAVNNIYKTEEIAERMKAYYLALEEARWYPTEEEWKDEMLAKYSVYYDVESKRFETEYNIIVYYNLPVFKTEEECKSFYDKWQAEALIDWGIKNEL